MNRNAQFERIAKLKALFEAKGNPVISVDTKKKELIGNLFREVYGDWDTPIMT